jgi:hypothetical protein
MNATLMPDILTQSVHQLRDAVDSEGFLSSDLQDGIDAAAMIADMCVKSWEHREVLFSRGLSGKAFVSFLDAFDGLIDVLVNEMRKMVRLAADHGGGETAEKLLAASFTQTQNIKEEIRSLRSWYQPTTPGRIVEAVRNMKEIPPEEYLSRDDLLASLRAGENN